MATNEIKDQANRVLSQTREIAQVIKGLEDDSNNAVGAIALGRIGDSSAVLRPITLLTRIPPAREVNRRLICEGPARGRPM